VGSESHPSARTPISCYSQLFANGRHCVAIALFLFTFYRLFVDRLRRGCSQLFLAKRELFCIGICIGATPSESLINRLLAPKLDSLIKSAGPRIYRHHDGQGLYLVVDGRCANGKRPPSASWIFRYMIDGKARMMGLGSYPGISFGACQIKGGRGPNAEVPTARPLGQTR